VDIQREKDVERLRQAALLLEAENQRLVAKVVELTRQLATVRGEDAVALQLRISELEQQLAKRNHLLFGTSSEQRVPGQKSGKNGRISRPGHGPKPQPQLQLVEKVHRLDVPDQICNSCGGQLGEWEGQSEDSEEIDVIERKFVRVKHRRQKYRCKCGGCVETAPAPPKLFEGARYSINWAIEVAVQKYLDHCPLERQVRIMAREGLSVDSQTLWDYLERLVRLLQPAWHRLHKHALRQPVLGADETRWPLMGVPDGEPSRWHVWALSTTEAMVYRILESRSAEAAREVLGEYAGIVMADGYGAYESLQQNGGKFALVNCWSHVRRAYFEIQENFPQTETVLDLIGELYNVEALCPTGPPGDETRRRLRDTKSRAIVTRIQQWALEQRALPQSGLGKAIAYMGGRWKGLVRFLDDPRIPLDNNATERGLRGPVVGRKNHYGSRSRRGTEVAALLYSLLESAKLCRLEPKTYLRRAVTAALAGEQIPLPHEIASEAESA
jgi:transposase